MDYLELAQQLRKPEGKIGRQIGGQLNISNKFMNLVAIQCLNLSKGDNVLEIGMGNGFFCQNVLEKAADGKYTGYDFSEVMKEEAERINSVFMASGKAEFILGDAAKMPFISHTFEKVFAVNSVYFWEDPDLVCSNVYDVLKPDGIFLISLRTPEMMKDLPFVQYGFKIYDENELRSLFTRNNYRSIDIQRHIEPPQEFEGVIINMESFTAIGYK